MNFSSFLQKVQNFIKISKFYHSIPKSLSWINLNKYLLYDDYKYINKNMVSIKKMKKYWIILISWFFLKKLIRNKNHWIY